jgi:hypothetical protein
VILPRAAFHVTDLSETVPCTLAAKVNVPPVDAEAEPGVTVTEVTTGLGGGVVGAAVIVTVAVPDLVESALLVAVTVSVPAFDGAV